MTDERDVERSDMSEAGQFRRKMCGNPPTHDYPQYNYRGTWAPDFCPFCARAATLREVRYVLEGIVKLSDVDGPCALPNSVDGCWALLEIICTKAYAALDELERPAEERADGHDMSSTRSPHGPKVEPATSAGPGRDELDRAALAQPEQLQDREIREMTLDMMDKEGE